MQEYTKSGILFVRIKAGIFRYNYCCLYKDYRVE